MDLILNILRSISYAIVEPTYLLMFVIIGIMFYIRNKKITMIHKVTMGQSKYSALELTLSQLVLGVLIGALGSILLGVLGVVFTENSGVELVFLVSILLIFVKPKFVCFSYSAAIIGLFSIIINIIATYTNKEAFLDVNILQIMTMVGVLHICEALLILLDGKRGAIPVFTQKDGKIVGGFSFDRIWAIPVAILTALSISIGDTFIAPDWWPLVNSKQTLAMLGKAFIASLPFYGMIGFKTITFTQTETKKIATATILNCIYGVSLVLVAQVASLGIIGQLIVVIYAPLAHEAMLKIQYSIEKKGKYLYYSDENGIAILEVLYNSPAFISGIRRGDRVIEVNNQQVVTELQILEAIKNGSNNILMKVKKLSGELVDYTIPTKNKRIGILLVPRLINKDKIFAVNQEQTFKKILEELKNKK